MIWKGDASGRRLAKCMVTLYDQVDARWPNRDKSSDGSIGDAAHQQRASDHNPGADGVVEAIDLTHDPAGGFDCHKFAETLRIARDPRLEYMIWNRQIMYAGGSKPWQWQAYSGSNPHTSHIHISCQPDPAIYDNPAPWVIERAAARPGLMTDIVATVFGGPSDSMSGKETAYGALIAPGWWERPGVALPARFSERPLPRVRIYHAGKSVDAPVIDVGPWNIDDAYWRTGTRPRAESGFDDGWTGAVRKTNRAGIDVTPPIDRALGLNGKGLLDWEFITNTQQEEPHVSDPSQTPATLTMDQKSAIQLALVIAPLLPPPANTVLPMLLGSAASAPPALPPPTQPPPVQLVPPSQPAQPPAQPGGIGAVLTAPGTKLGAILGIATIAMQLFGILPPSLGENATQAGQGISFLAGASPLAGAMGLFQTIGRLFGGGK